MTIKSNKHINKISNKTSIIKISLIIIITVILSIILYYFVNGYKKNYENFASDDSCAVSGCRPFNFKKSCQCDTDCVEIGDCCSDYESVCKSKSSTIDNANNIRSSPIIETTVYTYDDYLSTQLYKDLKTYFPSPAFVKSHTITNNEATKHISSGNN